MKTERDVVELVEKYLERHGMKYEHMRWEKDVFTVDTQCWSRLEAKLTSNGRITFKLDGNRASIYK